MTLWFFVGNTYPVLIAIISNISILGSNNLLLLLNMTEEKCDMAISGRC